MDFDQYVGSMKFMYSLATIEFDKLKTTDNRKFISNWVLSLKTDRSDLESGPGHTEFTVERGLLQKVAVYYDVNQYVFEYYCALRSAELKQKSDYLEII
ncbi:MAG: hypothetical protein HRU29_12085 [Rhizobiales bacterium]|nr:hypothetical protein [Hyphomicrobiales bacterium]NRB15127.1 hypothetical protein [Hyphomicrobiales bacterium]